MTRGRWMTRGVGSAVTVLACVALAVGAKAPSASAQVVDDDCRCVDPDGTAITNCTCFVMPDLPEVPQMPEIVAFGPGGEAVWALQASRPRLGVTVRTDQDDSYDGQGARVANVMESGPAAEAGIREGDIITSVDGTSLFQPLEDDLEAELDLDESIPVQRLLALARQLEPGESVEVGYLRDGEPRTTTVDVQDLAGMWGAWADEFAAEFAPRMERFRSDLAPRMERFREELRPRMEELREQLREQARTLEREVDRERIVIERPGSAARFGLRLTELTPGLAEYFGADEGVLVTDVDEGSSLGLRAGDVILGIGDREVTSAARATRILSTFDEDESLTFRVLRDGAEIDVMGRLND